MLVGSSLMDFPPAATALVSLSDSGRQVSDWSDVCG